MSFRYNLLWFAELKKSKSFLWNKKHVVQVGRIVNSIREFNIDKNLVDVPLSWCNRDFTNNSTV